MIKKLAITGGTHGNELTGVYLINKWKENPLSVQRKNFETLLLHTNLEAIKECRRYVDRDLNRSFSSVDLQNAQAHYEAKRACEINALLGPKGNDSTEVDFIVDLHSTTANMGLSLVVSNPSKLTWMAVRYLCVKEPKLNVYRWMGDEEDAFVDSIAPHGFAIEVGSIPQGVLRADLFVQTEALVYHLLDFFEKYNTGESLQECEQTIEIYDHVKLVDYPRDAEGQITAMIHQDRQNKDYKRIEKGDPLFLTLEGQTITYDEDQSLYGLFINEAAYYEKGFALCLAKKVSL